MRSERRGMGGVRHLAWCGDRDHNPGTNERLGTEVNVQLYTARPSVNVYASHVLREQDTRVHIVGMPP